MSPVQSLSIPTVRNRLPRQLSEPEVDRLVGVADVLMPGDAEVGPPSSHAEYVELLNVALAARVDVFDLIMAAVSDLEAVDEATLRRLDAEDAVNFQRLSTVLAGAYLMLPAVREAVNYPGQHRDVPGLEEAVDQLSDGIMDPVLDRGHFFTPTPEES